MNLFIPGVNDGGLLCSSNFWLCGKNPMVWLIKLELGRTGVFPHE